MMKPMPVRGPENVILLPLCSLCLIGMIIAVLVEGVQAFHAKYFIVLGLTFILSFVWMLYYMYILVLDYVMEIARMIEKRERK